MNSTNSSSSQTRWKFRTTHICEDIEGHFRPFAYNQSYPSILSLHIQTRNLKPHKNLTPSLTLTLSSPFLWKIKQWQTHQSSTSSTINTNSTLLLLLLLQNPQRKAQQTYPNPPLLVTFHVCTVLAGSTPLKLLVAIKMPTNVKELLYEETTPPSTLASQQTLLWLYLHHFLTITSHRQQALLLQCPFLTNTTDIISRH